MKCFQCGLFQRGSKNKAKKRFSMTCKGALHSTDDGDSQSTPCPLPLVLITLRKVQQDTRTLLHEPAVQTTSTFDPTAPSDPDPVSLALETIRRIDWCVENLETAVDTMSKITHMSQVDEDDKASSSSKSAVTMTSTLSDIELFAPNKDHIVKLLGEPDWWSLDVFKVEEFSNYRALTCVTYAIMLERNMFQKFRMCPYTFMCYITMVEANYRRGIPYHTSTHAADVVMATNVFLSSPAVRDQFTDLDILAALIASAVHDVDHQGFNNRFLINSCSDIALVYDNKSCLERHHLARGLSLLQEPNCDILTTFSLPDQTKFKKLIGSMVLATDMDNHNSVLAALAGVRDKSTSRNPPKLDHMDKVALLDGIVHTADVSNPAKPLPLYSNWCDRVMSEFFRQGDKEKQLGLEVSPMCDRSTVVVSQCQTGFIKFVVSPLFDVWVGLGLPEAKVGQELLDSNYKHYANQRPN